VTGSGTKVGKRPSWLHQMIRNSKMPSSRSLFSFPIRKSRVLPMS
jgi:hypothetical protein